MKTGPIRAALASLLMLWTIALLDPNRDNPTRTVRLSFLPG